MNLSSSASHFLLPPHTHFLSSNYTAPFPSPSSLLQPCFPSTTNASILHTRFKFAACPSLIIRSSSKPIITDESLSLLRVAAASTVMFFGLGIGVWHAAASTAFPPTGNRKPPEISVAQDTVGDNSGGDGGSKTAEKFEDEELNHAFEAWKSKTFALSVPLRIVALRSSMPASWVKDFTQSQGKRLKLRVQFVGTLDNIFSDLSMSFDKRKIGSASVAAADIVSIGDSWLNFAIKKAIIEPIRGVEDQDWYKGLNEKWKVCLRRNGEGKIDPNGQVWAAPYRWGTMVIAYKKSKFQKNKLAPIEDWADLWQPKLAGRISMVDSPREVIGAVLKYMGASYNTENIELDVAGGKKAVQQNLASFGKQVRLFDSMHYLKAFGVGDVWVAVGWSSDVIPMAKRMSNVVVVVPKSGASLWADLWAIPAATGLETNQIGGRVRGPSPLIHQWVEFCLQAARALPFKQEVIPGATPSTLDHIPIEVPSELTRNKPRLDTNLIAGVPPPEILKRCEFLEPLSDVAVSDYQWLIASMQKPDPGLFQRIQHHISSSVQFLRVKLLSKA